MKKSVRGISGSARTVRGIILAMLALLFLSTGCATKIKINMLQPAQYHDASLTKRVAVLPFDGPGGAEIASEFEVILGGVLINNTPYFSLVDRAAIDKIISEMKFSQSGLVDQSTAARIGKMVGAQGIYTGAVTVNKAVDNPYTQRRQECAQRQIRYDKDGRSSEGPCIRWRYFNVNCTRRVANFAVSPKLIDVSTGKILYSRNLDGYADSAGCDDGRPASSEMELLEKAKGIAKMKFRVDVAPFYVTREIALMDSTDGIDSSEAKDKLKRGIDYADKKRMDQACELWGEANRLSPNSLSLVYNLGVCAESRGEFDKAISLYRQADKLLGKPDDDISKALNRVTESLQNQKRLTEELKASGM